MSVKRSEVYPIAPEYRGLRSTAPIARRYGVELKPDEAIAAVYTGEKRRPRRGEWYLSGAEVEAYLAPSDLGFAYHIARLVIVRRYVRTEVIRALDTIGR